MRAWRAKVYIGDLVHDEDHSPTWIAQKIWERLRGLPYHGAARVRDETFVEIADQFQDTFSSYDEVNDVLNDLYDWGDVDKRLWIDTIDTDPAVVAKKNQENGVMI